MKSADELVEVINSLTEYGSITFTGEPFSGDNQEKVIRVTYRFFDDSRQWEKSFVPRLLRQDFVSIGEGLLVQLKALHRDVLDETR